MDIVLHPGGAAVIFDGGWISVTYTPTLRTYQSNPVIADYQDRIDPETYPGTLPLELARPLDFRAGEISPYIPNIGLYLVLIGSESVQFPGGSLYIETTAVPAVGALTEFAAWPLTGREDPVEFYATTGSSATSGGVGQAWTRLTAVVALPDGRTKPFNRAPYLAVGSRIASVPTGEKQFLKKVMVEPAAIGATLPSTYSKAREIQATIHPDRLNFVTNPSFETNTTGWTLNPIGYTAATSLVTSTAQKKFGANSGLVTWPTAGAPGSATGINVTSLVIGRKYIASVWVFVPTGSPDVRLSVFGLASSQYTGGIKNQWVRRSVVFTATATTHYVMVDTPTPTAGNTCYIDGLMVEAGETLRDYFDGSFGPDYLWETAGVAHNARSYFYLNRAERYATVKRIIEQNVPLGIGVADPKFAVLPVE